MNLVRQLVGLALVGVFAAGCSTIDKLNPFSTDSATKTPPLPVLVNNDALAVKWRANAGAAGEYSFVPAVSGQAVFAAARDGSVSRFENGTTIWKVNLGLTLSAGVGTDGSVVVVGSPKADVIALEASTGKQLWRARAGSEILAAPVVSDGTVIVRSGDSRIMGFAVADGKRRWVYQRSTPALALRSSVGVRVDSGRVLAGFPGGKMVAISLANGSVMWEATVALPKGATELERVTDITSEPVTIGGIVCSVAFQGKLSCFEASSGNSAWSRDVSSSVGLDADSNYVYVTDEEGSIDALDRSSGASIWRQDKLQGRGVGRPAAVGNRVAVVDSQGNLHLLQRTDGAMVGRNMTDASGVRAPLVVGGGMLLAQTVDGNLYALATGQ